MIFDYLEEYIPETQGMYVVKLVPKKSLFDRIKSMAVPLVFGATLLYGNLDLKSNSGFEKIPLTKDYFTKNAGNSLEKLITDKIPIEPIIAYIGCLDEGNYSDNELYKSIRLRTAKEKIKEYAPNSDVIVVDKTFQKALFFEKNGQEYTFKNEYDCGTAKVYGKKIRPGDGKTPEGMFTIYSVEPAHDKLWDGEKAYGAYFLRILGSIGMHGNGTDKVKNPGWRNDKAYMEPDPLGVYDENFAFGPSHGCIRLDNKIIREKVEDGTIKSGTQVLIYENTEMTKILRNVY